MGTDIADFRKRQFPRQYDLGETEPFQETHAIQIGYGHLGAPVKRQLWYDAPGNLRHSQVLHDDAIDRQIIQLFQIGRQIR